MKKILILSVLVLSINTFAEIVKIKCATENISGDVVLQLSNDAVLEMTALNYTEINPEPKQISTAGVKTYQIIVSDSMDTITDFEFDIENGEITNKKRFSSGHDSDNADGYLEAQGNQAFQCSVIK